MLHHRCLTSHTVHNCTVGGGLGFKRPQTLLSHVTIHVLHTHVPVRADTVRMSWVVCDCKTPSASVVSVLIHYRRGKEALGRHVH